MTGSNGSPLYRLDERRRLLRVVVASTYRCALWQGHPFRRVVGDEIFAHGVFEGAVDDDVVLFVLADSPPRPSSRPFSTMAL